MEKNKTPRPGDIYHHFKGNLYQIITVATHTETGESMVVYQALYGEFKTYVRPLLMFTSKTDKEKYPQATQEYRFVLRSEVNENNVNNKSDECESITWLATNTITDGVTSLEGLAKQVDAILKNETVDTSKVNTNTVNTNTVETSKVDTSTVDKNTVNKYTVNSSDGNTDDIHMDENSYENVNTLLLKFLDASSYTKKLEIITSNTKHLTDRIINDMAVSLDCTVDEGPLEQRIQGLIYCLQANRRFEDRRLR